MMLGTVYSPVRSYSSQEHSLSNSASLMFDSFLILTDSTNVSASWGSWTGSTAPIPCSGTPRPTPATSWCWVSSRPGKPSPNRPRRPSKRHSLSLSHSLSISVTICHCCCRTRVHLQSINQWISVYVCIRVRAPWTLIKKLTRIHYCVMLHHYLLLLLDNYDDDILRNGSKGRVMGIGIRKRVVEGIWIKRPRCYIRVDDTILDRFRDFETKL